MIPVILPIFASVLALIVVFVREGQFQQLSALQEARQAEMNTLRTEVGTATANALSALQRVTETQRRLESAETESLELREKLGAVTFQLGQERIKREGADATARDFKMRSQVLERRCQSLEQQCVELNARGEELNARSQVSEERAAAAEAEAAALQQRVATLLLEAQQIRSVPLDGTETAARTAVAAAEVARVEQAIHAQAEELLAALAVLRREAAGFLSAGPAAPAPDAPPAEGQTLILQDGSKGEAAAPAEGETVRPPLPHALGRLTWSEPDEANDRQIELIAS